MGPAALFRRGRTGFPAVPSVPAADTRCMQSMHVMTVLEYKVGHAVQDTNLRMLQDTEPTKALSKASSPCSWERCPPCFGSCRAADKQQCWIRLQACQPVNHSTKRQEQWHHYCCQVMQLLLVAAQLLPVLWSPRGTCPHLEALSRHNVMSPPSHTMKTHLLT